MKNSKNKKAILLTSTTALTVLSSVASLSVVKAYQNHSYPNTKASDSSLRNLTRTIVENAINPNRLIFMSEDLSSTNTPIVNSNGEINEMNVQKWKNFFANVKTLPDSNEKNELLGLENQMDGCIQLNKDIQKLKEIAIDNNLIQQNLEFLIQTLIQNSGFKQNMSEIEGIDNIKEKMLSLSGIVEAQKIALISNPTSFTQTDLVLDSASATTPIGITNAAEVEYKQLIKIAEINTSNAGNYGLKFSFKKNSYSLTASGVLYIKNDENQLANSTMSDLIKNLDIFGRKIEQTNNALLEGALENFVFSKNGTNLEVFVRVKADQQFLDMEFLSEIEGSPTSLLKPTRFGILDVQATDEVSFVSKITANTNNLLVDMNSPEIVKNVQMFSSSLTSKSTKSINQGWENDRKLEFYQVGTLEFSLPLFFATNTSEANSKLFVYSPINIYTGGVNSNNQQKIKLSTNGEAATVLSPEKYDLYKEIKDQLLIQMQDPQNFDTASTITLDSALDTSSKITRQTLTFSDFFYAIGNRSNNESWAAVSRLDDTKHIAIEDPTQKIFFEKPNSFIETSLVTAQSTTKAEETINERTTVINFLGSVYNEFSKANSGEFNGETYDLGEVSVWTASGSLKARSGYSNIKSETKRISGQGNDIYKALNSNWNMLSDIMNSIFNIESQKDRYLVDSNNSANSIVVNYLTKASEFASNASEIEKVISNAIEIVKEDPNIGGSITVTANYRILTTETKNKLASSVIELIKNQFGSIEKEFESRLYDPLYNEIKKVLASSQNFDLPIIKNVSELLETTKTSDGIDLIKYKNKSWESISSNRSTTFKTAIKSLFDVLYFSNNDLNNPICLGDSIFNSTQLLDAFSSLNSESLTTFDSDSVEGKKNKVLIYNGILTLLGSPKFNLQNALNKMLETGQPLQFEGFNLEEALKTTLTNVATNEKKRVEETYDKIVVESYYLDDVIAGTNTIIALNWKLKQLLGSTTTFSSFTNSRSKYSSKDLISRINSIINSTPQAFSNELSIWSNIIDSNFNYSAYSQDLSGRNGESQLNNKANAIVQDDNIMASRFINTPMAEALLLVEKILRYLWWIILALIAIGVLVASGVGIATKERQVKLSSRPALKWLLVAGVLFGIILAAAAILLGIGII